MEFLVDWNDAESLGGGRAANWNGVPGDLDGAAIGRVDTGEDLHEGRLAGSVLAHQRVDFAWLEVELDVFERLDARKRLGDAAQTQYWQIIAIGGSRNLHVMPRRRWIASR